MASIEVTLRICFTDGHIMTLKYDQEVAAEGPTANATFRKDIQFERIVLETEGDLMIIPMNNVRYVRATPAPDKLPTAVLKNVKIITE